jgi:hypothetical protein
MELSWRAFISGLTSQRNQTIVASCEHDPKRLNANQTQKEKNMPDETKRPKIKIIPVPTDTTGYQERTGGSRRGSTPVRAKPNSDDN